MPLYEYYCECGNSEEKLASFDKKDLQVCKCGLPMHIKISVPHISTSGLILVTKDGKAAHGRDMALRTLNSPGDNQTGPTSRFSGDSYKRIGLQAATAGLEKPQKTLY